MLTLDPTGRQGFEGLIASALQQIVGVPFRLASSGTQGGLDGTAASERVGIAFEGKLYRERVPRTEIVTKVADLGRNNEEPDLAWILGATVEVSSQVASQLRHDAAKSGITVVVLDWIETELPELALALAMGEDAVERFLTDHVKERSFVAPAIAALRAIRGLEIFARESIRLKSDLDGPSMGFALARASNAKRFEHIFSDTRAARTNLGQALCPLDATKTVVLARKDLHTEFKSALTMPPDGAMIAILGDEGCGKSWFAAQGWLALDERPMLVFVPADGLADATLAPELERLLIAKLIEQTGDDPTERNVKRWSKRFAAWRVQPAPSKARLVVVLDGINQRPDLNWGRIVEGLGFLLDQIGGAMVVTSRLPFFRDRVRGRLSLRIREIRVSEWKSAERDEILVARGIAPSALHAPVVDRLRNPRLLGIALRLLDNDAISSIAELDVSRLLFEHIRISEPYGQGPGTAIEFTGRLRQHAQAVLDRLGTRQLDDLRVFDIDLNSVVDGRFFREVEGDPQKYEIAQEGLTVALGLAVIARLQRARRSEDDLDATLSVLLEPIAALDDAANVAFAALTAACLIDGYADPLIAASLIRGFVRLQNPDASKYPAFCRLARERPGDFMTAARALCLANEHSPNFDWLQGALMAAACIGSSSATIVREAANWLSVHSLSPDFYMRAHPGQDPADVVEREREIRRSELAERLGALTAEEVQVLNRLEMVDGNPSTLSRLALHLLARQRLAPLSDHLAEWCLGQALNSDHGFPYREFIDLVSLNRTDWAEARAALLRSVAPLRTGSVSRIGKWALVAALRATGDPVDAEEAHGIVEELTKDREQFPSWRRIESYCATDPCDPGAIEPENIRATATEYAAVDVAKLAQGLGQSAEDQFLDDARSGMARFLLPEAATKHTEFADHVLCRRGFPLRQGILTLRDHLPLLTLERAEALIAKWLAADTSGDLEGLSDQDRWIAAQYHLLLSFPFVSGSRQLEALLETPPDQLILLDLLHCMKPPAPDMFEQCLDAAREANDTHRQYLLLAVAKETRVSLSGSARAYVCSTLSSSSEKLRAQALALIVAHDDAKLLGAVVDCWVPPAAETESGFEEWYGSLALVLAAQNGLGAGNEILDRLSPRAFGRAARLLGGELAVEIARRIDASIHHASVLATDDLALDIELRAPIEAERDPVLFSIGEPERPPDAESGPLRQPSKSSRDIEDRQRRNYDAFLAFKQRLTASEARIVLDHLSLADFSAIVEAAPDLAERWFLQLSSQPPIQLPAVHNLIVLLAFAFSEKRPDRTELLLRKVEASAPMVRIAFGRAGLDLNKMAVWGARDHGELNDLRFERLDRAKTDQEIAVEVLAALMNQRQEVLASYIERGLASEEPGRMARAIMVAGFSNPSESNKATLWGFENAHGLLGDASRAARYAYERNTWSQHWFAQLCQTDDPTEFWQAKMLMSKIVDPRFDTWRGDFAQTGSAARLFGSMSENLFKRRYDRWAKHRGKKLFGREASSPLLLDAINRVVDSSSDPTGLLEFRNAGG
ncbi:hypothetical protein [Bosea sp. TAF32]|uniref:hypothetical protein n=1 Tax=Bosea sp. TAF32 TaxID=3237482 RepID=UPI003F93E428